MKKIILFALLPTLMCSGIQAQKTVQSKIIASQVYFNGAQITREASISLQPGTNVLMFDDLPQNLNPQTLIVESTSSITLISVKHNLNYLKNQEKPAEVVKLEDSLKLLQNNLQYKNAMLQVYREEESMLIANKDVGGANTGVQADNLKNSAEYFRTRMIDVKTKQYELTLEIQKINESIGRISNTISAKMSTRGGAVSEVYVTVDAKSTVQAKINLTYYVPNAGWSPLYDIRATQIGKPIQLILKANVYNNTGEDWNNVKLTLSSANPLQSGVKPTLNPWYLYAYVAQNYKYDSDSKRSEKTMNAPSSATGAASDYEMDAFETTVAYTTVQQNLTTIEYVISIPYSVPSDGKEYTVDIQEYTLPATYEYQSVPKIDKDAFLIARISGWDKYNLLPGAANLFAEGKFIGNSYIDPASVKDTLNISLGRDKGIIITREVLKDFSSEKIIGTNKTIVRTYEISVRNKKNTDITLVIEDQIPLSNQKDIVVEFDAKTLDNAEYNEATGMIRWKRTIKQGETIKLKYSFVVKHPKDMNLQVW